MAQLNVYDKFGEQLESHVIEGDLLSWIKANCPDYKETIRPPYYATLNGKIWHHDRHGETLNNNDVIDLTIEPKDPVSIALVVVAVLSAAYAYYVASNLPDYQNSSEPGKSIYAPSANANSIVPSGLIREVAGQMTIYPDLICPPHRRYENNDEYLYLMLSVGAGYFSISDDNIFIAETPIINYAGDISAEIYEPGATVSSSEASENWYQSNEVADLKLTTESTPQFGQWTVDVSGADITSYLDGVAETFPFVVDEVFQITSGSNQGYYKVSSLSGSSDEIATVKLMKRSGGDTGRLEALTQQVNIFVPGVGSRRGTFRRVSFEIEAEAPTLVTVTGESVDWTGINGGVNWEGPFQVAPQGETARYAEVDVLFPQGLTSINDDGENIDQTVEIAIQWREIGSATWTTVSSTSYTAQTYDQLGYTVAIDFGSEIEPEFRFRRITKDAEENKIADIVVIRRVKSLLETPTSYADITTIAMRLKGTNALARTAENKINIRGATRKLPTIAQLEAGSFDISASATETVSAYDTSNISLQSSVQMTGVGNPPDSSGTEYGFDFNSDGEILLVYDNARVKIFRLNVNYRPEHGYTYQGYFDSARDVNLDARFAGDSHVLVSGWDNPLSTPILTMYDVTIPATGAVSATVNSNYVVNEVAGSDPLGGQGIYCNSAGTKFWVADGSAKTIYQYSVSTPYDLSTASYDSDSFTIGDLGEGDNNIAGFHFADSESKLYIIDVNGNVSYFTLSVPGDIGTAPTFVNITSTGISSPEDIAVSSGSLTVSSIASTELFLNYFDMNEVVDTAATRSIARFVGWTLYDALGSDAATMVDWDSLDTLNTLWESRGDYLDAELVDETTLWEALKVMLAPGYAEPTIKEGQFLPVRIAAGSDYNHLYTPDIMTGDGLQISHSHYDAQEPDGVDVEYFSLDTNQMAVVECRATGDAGIRPKRIQAIGITDRTKAWRYGMRERNRLRYKPGNLEFSTEMDALNSEYGDAIAVASDIFTSQCGEVVSYSAPEVTLDFEPEFGSGTHYMAFRNRDGEMSGLYTVIATSNPDTVELTSPTSLDFTPVTDGSMDSTFCTFGNASEWGIRAICRRISPQGENNVNVTAEEYVAAVYQDDDNSPPS